MNKQCEMGKTMFEVMNMRKNSKESPFQLRKYYGIMIVLFVLFLGVMAYYSATFRQKRDQAKQCNQQDNTDDNRENKRKDRTIKDANETYHE